MDTRRFALACGLALALIPTGAFAGGGGVEGEPAEPPAAAAAEASCRLSDDPQAWGDVGNGGWARQWLLGQCALADAGVITYVDIADQCTLESDPASCESENLLGACGPATVTLRADDCRACRRACVDTAAVCQRDGVCSNNKEQRCDNDEQCSFSAPVDGACGEGSTLVDDWSQYYALVGGTGAAPVTYCAWRGSADGAG